ncbi:MAG: signal recognition particle-docking protein FtsY, partial [Candidatus Thalassarchaeum sp.]|nr:signal recognition particle-docking protein FtsY [Candidatus Thalassarchaeum sp.]
MNPMESTTGRTLVASGPAEIEVDFGDSATKTGGRVVKGSGKLDQLLEELEEELLTSDMAQSAVEEVIQTLKATLIGSRISTTKKIEVVVEEALRNTLLRLLESGYWDFDKTVDSFLEEDSPVVIMVVGVNGTGKTTTTAKMANRLSQSGHSVVLAAADTFRAGAIDQLATHAERLDVRCIRSQRGGDAAAVARDAVDSAKARGEDVVIIDTAGRMQNKTNLMEELRKVHRVTQPHLVIFVADALAGNDAVSQAIEFQRMLSFDGAALCKLDTDAKGGAALSIAHATGRPIVLAGIGQGYDDLIDFDPGWLIDSILE